MLQKNKIQLQVITYKRNDRKDESKKHEKNIYTRQIPRKMKLVLQYKINLKEKAILGIRMIIGQG